MLIQSFIKLSLEGKYIMQNDNTKNEKQRLDEMEALLIKCESELLEIKRFNKRILEIQKNIKTLSQYYRTDYIKDYDNNMLKDTVYRILDEDSIYDVITYQHIESVKLLKTIAKNL